MMRKRINSNITPAPNARVIALYCCTLAVWLVVLPGHSHVAVGQRRPIPGSPVVQQGGNDAASTMFRSGRDLITDQDWAKAQEKFSQFVAAYPADKNIDAALYWMAYAMNKQSKTDLCRKTL